MSRELHKLDKQSLSDLDSDSSIEDYLSLASSTQQESKSSESSKSSNKSSSTQQESKSPESSNSSNNGLPQLSQASKSPESSPFSNTGLPTKTHSSITITQDISNKDLNKIYQLVLELKESINELKESNNELKATVETLKSIKKRTEDNFKTEVKFGDKNLIAVHASTCPKYVTKLMEILFTVEERKNGLPSADGISTSKRTPLDKDKVQLLKGNFYLLNKG